MAPPKRPWFRMYVEIFGDKKLRRQQPATRWLCAAMFGAARQSPRPGYLMIAEGVPMTVEDIADFAALTPREVKAGLDSLAEVRIVAFDEGVRAWWVPKFGDRQYESDDTTARTRKHRSKATPSTDDGTFHDCSGNGQRNDDVTHQRTESETETEKPPPNPPPTSLALVPHEASPAATDPASAVFDAWVQSVGRTSRTVLTPERRRVILKQLKHYPPEDLIDAVRGWRHSSHHRGENDRNTVYNDIELLLRDAKRIEMFRDLERDPPARPLPKGLQGIQAWLSRSSA